MFISIRSGLSIRELQPSSMRNMPGKSGRADRSLIWTGASLVFAGGSVGSVVGEANDTAGRIIQKSSVNNCFIVIVTVIFVDCCWTGQR